MLIILIKTPVNYKKNPTIQKIYTNYLNFHFKTQTAASACSGLFLRNLRLLLLAYKNWYCTNFCKKQMLLADFYVLKEA